MGTRPRPRCSGRPARPANVARDQLAAIAAALDCTIESTTNRAALSASTRVIHGLEPLGPASILVAGQEFDLTDDEADPAWFYRSSKMCAPATLSRPLFRDRYWTTSRN